MDGKAHYPNFYLLLWKHTVLQRARLRSLFLIVFLTPLMTLYLWTLDDEIVPRKDFQYLSPTMKYYKDWYQKAYPGKSLPNYHLKYTGPAADIGFISSNLTFSAPPQKYDNVTLMVHDLLMDDKTGFAGLEFRNDSKAPNVSVKMHFPALLRTSMDDVSWMTDQLVYPGAEQAYQFNAKVNEDDSSPLPYLTEGVIPLIYALLINFYNKLDVMQKHQRLSIEARDEVHMWDVTKSFTLFFFMGCIYPFIYLTQEVTRERECQQKQVLLRMNVKNWMIGAAWFVKYFTLLAISFALVLIILITPPLSILSSLEWLLPLTRHATIMHSNILVIYLHLLLFAAMAISSCLLISVFTRNDVQAEIATGLFIGSGFIIFYVLNCFQIQTDAVTKMLLCVLPGAAVSFGMDAIFMYDTRGETFGIIQLASSRYRNYNYALILIWWEMAIVGALYGVLCLYLEEVLPYHMGIPGKWYLPFGYNLFTRRKSSEEEDDRTSSMYRSKSGEVNTNDDERKVGIEVKELKKNYGKAEALKPCDMQAVEDETTVILGRRGSGKTTILAMLMCNLRATSGTATVNGHSIDKKKRRVKKSIGICTQHNVLYSDMTVKQHIYFYSHIRGKQVNKKYLDVMGLSSFANVRAANLPLDMQRVLSLCLAYSSGAKVVLCDEPTKGVCPAWRCEMWNFIACEKIGRTTLITTQSKDEAEALADHIYVLNDKKLKYLGAPAEIRRNKELNYELICIKGKNCQVQPVTNVLRTHIAGISPQRNSRYELVYELPESQAPAFEKALKSLEASAGRLNVHNYEIRSTSGLDARLKESNIASNKHYMVGRRYNVGFFAMHKPGCLTQWHAMFLKMCVHHSRNLLFLLAKILLPALIFLALISILLPLDYWNEVELKDQPPFRFDYDQYPGTKVAVVRQVPYYPTANTPNGSRVVWRKCQLNDKFYVPQCSLLLCWIEQFPGCYFGVLKKLQQQFQFNYLAIFNNDCWCEEHCCYVKVLSNHFLHNAPIAYVMDARLTASKAMDDKDFGAPADGPKYKISVTLAPLPYSLETRLKYMGDYAHYILMPLFLAIALTAPLFILFVTRERVIGCKLQQFMAGVSTFVFWLSHLMWDMLIYTLTSVVTVIAVGFYHLDGFENLAPVLLVMLTFALMSLLLMYICSGLMSTPQKAYLYMTIVYIASIVFFFFFVETDFRYGKPLNYVLQIIPMYSLCICLWKINHYAVQQKTCDDYELLTSSERCQKLKVCCGGTYSLLAMESPGIMKHLLFMMAVSLVFFLILLLWDSVIIRFLMHFLMFWKRINIEASRKDDFTVIREKRRIVHMSLEEIETYSIVADEMSKNYVVKPVVKPISFRLKQSESLGLLGGTDVGKTTVIKTLAGEQWITGGIVYVRGKNMSTRLRTVRKKIGYLPQNNNLLDEMTAWETLLMYSLLRGIRRKNVFQYVDIMSKRLILDAVLDKRTADLTHSERRRLSLAIALINEPVVVLLDEPTEGVDLPTRRYMWDEIILTRNLGTTYVVATRSVEECEAICTHVAIMKDGDFKCQGLVTDLRMRFCQTVLLKIRLDRKLDKELSRKLRKFFKYHFPSATLRAHGGSTVIYQISTKDVKCSNIFGVLERNKQNMSIEYYSVTQETLDDAFHVSYPTPKEVINHKTQCGGMCPFGYRT